jgi:deazaflavin-dependent oxidoreductase (nitroreductase family)
VLLLTTTGRKSGARRTTPLGYFEDAEAYVIVASNAGFETHPAWFHNLKANPRARIEAEGRTLEVAAEVAGSDERGRLWARLLELSPGYGRYAERTRREIPLVRLRPAPG